TSAEYVLLIETQDDPFVPCDYRRDPAGTCQPARGQVVKGDRQGHAKRKAFRQAEAIMRAHARELDPRGELVRSADRSVLSRLSRKLNVLDAMIRKASQDRPMMTASESRARGDVRRVGRKTYELIAEIRSLLNYTLISVESGDKEGAAALLNDYMDALGEVL